MQCALNVVLISSFPEPILFDFFRKFTNYPVLNSTARAIASWKLVRRPSELGLPEPVSTRGTGPAEELAAVLAGLEEAAAEPPPAELAALGASPAPSTRS